MDILFIIAIILLPFDNLFFAPSSGWATVTPIILFLYVLFNTKYLKRIIKKYNIFLLFFLISFIISLFNYVLHGINLSACINTLMTIFLGVCILLSFEIYFVQKKNDFKKICKYIICSYLISLIIGILQFMTIKFNIGFLQILFDLISKRNYLLVSRVQYSFTEPSFIGMHLFGVLLPIYYCTKNKKILIILITFIISSIIFNSSVRFILDALVVSLIIFVIHFIKKRKIYLLAGGIVLALIGFIFLYNYNPRVQSIVSKGVYADSSLSARYFRVEASIYGYIKKPINLITGYGMGNAVLPLKIGYDEAYENYKNSYYGEINLLNKDNYHDPSASLCLYIRLISEYGILLFILFFYCIRKVYTYSDFKYKLELLLILAYLYLQFDSYAFYTLWLFIFILRNSKKESDIFANKN